MKDSEILRKAEAGEGMTVAEMKRYKHLVKPVTQVYGKYGTLAKIYIERHNFGKLLCLAGHLPEYLHGVDEQAERMYDVMYKKLSSLDKYKHTSDYMDNLRKETEMRQLIEEEILSELVYVY